MDIRSSSSFSIRQWYCIAAILSVSSIFQFPASSKDLPAYLKKVESLIVSNKYDEAIKLARALEKTHPQSALVKGMIASAYMYKGDNHNAEMEAKKALRLDGKSYEAHWVLSNVYMAIGKADLGTKEFELSAKYQSHKYCAPCFKKSTEVIEKIQKQK